MSRDMFSMRPPRASGNVPAVPVSISLSVFALSIGMSCAAPVLAQGTLPQGGAYVSGSGSIASAGNTLTVTQPGSDARRRQLEQLFDRRQQHGRLQQRFRCDAKPCDRRIAIVDSRQAQRERQRLSDQSARRRGRAARRGHDGRPLSLLRHSTPTTRRS